MDENTTDKGLPDYRCSWRLRPEMSPFFISRLMKSAAVIRLVSIINMPVDCV